MMYLNILIKKAKEFENIDADTALTVFFFFWVEYWRGVSQSPRYQYAFDSPPPSIPITNESLKSVNEMRVAALAAFERVGISRIYFQGNKHKTLRQL